MIQRTHHDLTRNRYESYTSLLKFEETEIVTNNDGGTEGYVLEDVGALLFQGPAR